jgi:HSP20 family molecular chaperone IbpA
MQNKNNVAVVHKSDAPVGGIVRESEFVRPSTEIHETEDAYVITVDMPGVPKESISVTIDKDSLVVKGTSALQYAENASLLVAELHRSGYYRAFNLGEGIDRKSIDARHENGVLTLRLLKKDEIRTREIVIR